MGAPISVPTASSPMPGGRCVPLAPEGAVAQAKTLEAAGYQEIVVTGIELSGYGRDLPSPSRGWRTWSRRCAGRSLGCGCGWVPWNPGR